MVNHAALLIKSIFYLEVLECCKVTKLDSQVTLLNYLLLNLYLQIMATKIVPMNGADK